jgi:hypothetical protein
VTPVISVPSGAGGDTKAIIAKRYQLRLSSCIPVTLDDIESRLLHVLDRCTGLVEDDRLQGDRELTRAGEPGVALENLCEQLLDNDAIVPTDLVAELAKLGTAMELDEKHWKRLAGK